MTIKLRVHFEVAGSTSAAALIDWVWPTEHQMLILRLLQEKSSESHDY